MLVKCHSCGSTKTVIGKEMYERITSRHDIIGMYLAPIIKCYDCEDVYELLYGAYDPIVTLPCTMDTKYIQYIRVGINSNMRVASPARTIPGTYRREVETWA